MRIKIFLLVFGAVFFTACSDSSAIDLKEGNWILEMKSEIAGMSMQMPAVTSEECITKDNMIPAQQNQAESGCKITDKKINGSTVTWTAVCPESKSKGTITYKGITFDGRIDVELTGSSKVMKMTTLIKGRYKAPCNK